MDSDETVSKRGGRGRGRGGRARSRGRARGRGRGKRNIRIISSDEECAPEVEEPIIECQPEPEPERKPERQDEIILEKENEPINITKIDMEADISQLEAPTFTTIQRGPPEPMLRLKWDHKVSLIGEKVLNPMIHCCDQCLKPILIYGRMIPCKHVFCLKCGRAEPLKVCPRCKEKVCRVEQSVLGTVFMCTHGGTRYGNTGCRRTYLSQRDLQAHINHRHVSPLAPSNENISNKSVSIEPKIIPSCSTTQRKVSIEPQQVSRSTMRNPQSFSSNISVVQTQQSMSTRTNLITVPIQDSQQSSISSVVGIMNSQQPQTDMSSVNVNCYYNSNQSQSNYGNSSYTNLSQTAALTQNFANMSTINQNIGSAINTITTQQQGIHNLLPRPPPTPVPGPQTQQYYTPYGQQFNQMSSHYQSNRQYDQQNYNSGVQNQQWNHNQQYYR